MNQSNGTELTRWFGLGLVSPPLHSLGVTDPTNTLGLGPSATLRYNGLGSGAGRWTAGGGGGAVHIEGGADPTLDALLASVAAERKKR